MYEAVAAVDIGAGECAGSTRILPIAPVRDLEYEFCIAVARHSHQSPAPLSATASRRF
jgi:hypothetical protein